MQLRYHEGQLHIADHLGALTPKESWEQYDSMSCFWSWETNNCFLLLISVPGYKDLTRLLKLEFECTDIEEYDQESLMQLAKFVFFKRVMKPVVI